MRNMIKAIKLFKVEKLEYLDIHPIYLLLRRYDIQGPEYAKYHQSYKYKRWVRDIRILSYFITSYYKGELNEK